MNKFAGAVTRFNRASRHWEARHPILSGVANGLIFPTIWFAFGQLPWYPLATPAFIVIFVTMMTLWQRYLWRPGGMKRKRYERWVALQEQARTGADDPFPAAWYLDPSHRYDRRYWDGHAWTSWVADGGDAFVDDGTPIDQARAARGRTNPALPLLLGFLVGGLLGSALIVTALAFPHPVDFLAIQVGSHDGLGGIWLLTGAVIVVAVAASIAFGWRTPVRVSDAVADTATPPVQPKRATFVRSMTATVAIAAVAAWPTWIQGWPAIAGLATLAGLVGIALVGAVFAVKVSRIERRDRSTLCARGVLRALRGAFITNAS